MSEKLTTRMHNVIWGPWLALHHRQEIEHGWLREVAALEAKLETMERELSNAAIFMGERDEKVRRQAEQITRLETSRTSLREALAAAQQEEKEDE